MNILNVNVPKDRISMIFDPYTEAETCCTTLYLHKSNVVLEEGNKYTAKLEIDLDKNPKKAKMIKQIIVREYGTFIIRFLNADFSDEENAYNTLPESVAKQIVQQAKGFWLSEDEINYQNGGLMHFKVTNIKYRSLVPLLVKNWNFTIESTAKCQPRR